MTTDDIDKSRVAYAQCRAYSSFVRAVYNRWSGLLLTDEKANTLLLPTPSCTSRVACNVLAHIGFGAYSSICQLVERSSEVAFYKRDDGNVVFRACGEL